ncbi:hypothetical protein O9993_04135 [Vibrio lentus]|nr:hypothetical protein [Vibrio lentus]
MCRFCQETTLTPPTSIKGRKIIILATRRIQNVANELWWCWLDANGDRPNGTRGELTSASFNNEYYFYGMTGEYMANHYSLYTSSKAALWRRRRQDCSQKLIQWLYCLQ